MSRETGIKLAQAGDVEGAIRAFTEAGDWINLSVMLAREGRYAKALEAATRCDDPMAAHRQAMAVAWESGHYEVAKHHIDAGLEIDPSDRELLTARGTYRLARGDLGGWEDAKHRRWADVLRSACDEVEEWDCVSPLVGRSLAVLFEDGHGDRVMYSRFLRDLLKLNPSRLVLYCSPETTRMFYESFPGVDVVSSWTQIGDVDLWIGLSSLGRCRFPIDPSPYISTSTQYAMSARLAPTQNLRVGLVWAGNPDHLQDHTRSKPFSFFEPLLGMPGVDFYSLQFGERNVDHGGKLRELSVYCRDTADTCAAIWNLDLVVGVDTGMIHFAGALGVPAIVATFTPIDWRWGIEGSSSYWYSSVTVLRNPKIGEILGIIGRIPHGTLQLQLNPGQTVGEVSRYETHYGSMEAFTNDLWVARSLEEYGEWSRGELDLVESLVDEQSVVVDAGANVGAFCIPLSRFVRHILAFEPQSAVFDLLKGNAERCGRGNISLIEAGLASSSGQMFAEIVDLSRVCHPEGVKLQDSGSQPVTTLALDSLSLTRLDLLKADVEGMELDVLRGARETIARFRPLLYLECNDVKDRTELMEYVDSLSYRMYRHSIPLFNPKNFRGSALNIFGDWSCEMLLCVPRERFDLRKITGKLGRVRLLKG